MTTSALFVGNLNPFVTFLIFCMGIALLVSAIGIGTITDSGAMERRKKSGEIYKSNYDYSMSEKPWYRFKKSWSESVAQKKGFDARKKFLEEVKYEGSSYEQKDLEADDNIYNSYYPMFLKCSLFFVICLPVIFWFSGITGQQLYLWWFNDPVPSLVLVVFLLVAANLSRNKKIKNRSKYNK